MIEIKATITEQLQQLQMLMHRTAFHEAMGSGKPHSPHRGQGRVLAMLKMKPEISQKELTYLLGISKPALAELLAKLEMNGYITREPSEDDKRIVSVKLTEDGEKAADDLDGGAMDEHKILDCLNDEELTAFHQYLSRIIERYEEQFPDENLAERRRMKEAFMLRHARGFEGHGERHGGFDGCHGSFGHGHSGKF